MNTNKILTILALSVLNASPARSETVRQFLEQFHADPAKMMQRLPSEVRGGRAIPRGFIDYAKISVQLPERNEIRELIIENGAPQVYGLQMESDPSGKDRPERVTDSANPIKNLRELDNQRLTRIVLDPLPWADSYWPTYKGDIGIRYADKSFPNSGDWAKNYSYIVSNPAASIAAYGDPSAINSLSPAEKYDLAMGDIDFSLSTYAWAKGARVYEKEGAVPKWVGFCHGWAAAAHMNMPVNQEPVKIVSPAGLPITFYPQDVKALQSFLWANASPSTRFMGNRCNVSEPARDEFGRIVDPLCWDTNPGSWHIALTNQLGAEKRSLVMDSTFDFQVWNFPLADYKYRYFNPQSWQETTSLNSAIIPIEKFKLDKFRRYRSPEAKFIVGVYMDVSHVNAITPTRGKLTKIPLNTLRFIYDLELDGNLNIIGGEWYSNAHPDFVWTFAKDAQAVSIADAEILKEGWEPSSPVPASWATQAKRASKRGEPLFSFVGKIAKGLESPNESDSGPTTPDEVGPIGE